MGREKPRWIIHLAFLFFYPHVSNFSIALQGVVRFWEGWWCKAIPPVVARILSGDSTSPLTREARVVVLFEG